MTLNKETREQVRMKFGGRCAYCGCELTGKWHADHVKSVNREFKYVENGIGILQTRATGKLFKPENDTFENLFPACAPCHYNGGAMTDQDRAREQRAQLAWNKFYADDTMTIVQVMTKFAADEVALAVGVGATKLLNPAPSLCGVAGHFAFQLNGASCLMCQREIRLVALAVAEERKLCAEAICRNCATGKKVERTANGLWWHGLTQCHAAAIHGRAKGRAKGGA